MKTCRYKLSHINRPAVAEVELHGVEGKLTVCKPCSAAILRWMLAGTVNTVGQYPTSHYPIAK